MDTPITRRVRTDRPNADLAAAVDQAVAMAEMKGIRAAADFLLAHGAGFALTCRVLAEPGRRRATRQPGQVDELAVLAER